MKSWLLLLGTIGWVTAGDVLFIPSTLYPVHAQTMSVLARELAERGHKVTWLEIGPERVSNQDNYLDENIIEVWRRYWKKIDSINLGYMKLKKD